MGPGPARGGNAPLSPYVHTLIQRKARQLCRRAGFGLSDEEDLVQELTTRLLVKADQYDPARGASRDTFADRVIDTEVKMILRDGGRQKRAAGRTAASIEGGATLIGGKSIPLMEVIADADRQRVTGASPATTEHASDSADAIEHALGLLPPAAVAVAEGLKRGNVSVVGRELRMSRRQIYAFMALIRANFIAAGLDPKEK